LIDSPCFQKYRNEFADVISYKKIYLYVKKGASSWKEVGFNFCGAEGTY
jgi:hypothetical protein